ncbi:MAG TPA: hypothetical protein VMU33_14420 [Burkholderiaceae bacterium]|nr:hypothetical protein [Burkholderiaceae bacterium]
MSDRVDARDVQMDANNLFREDVITDRGIGTIRMLSPLRSDGTADSSRKTVFVGEAQMMTSMGPLPIPFEIEASSLAAAVAGYGDAAREAIERAAREIQDMRRQAASSIVIPQGGVGLPPGGRPGGGKIQIP